MKFLNVCNITHCSFNVFPTFLPKNHRKFAKQQIILPYLLLHYLHQNLKHYVQVAVCSVCLKHTVTKLRRQPLKWIFKVVATHVSHSVIYVPYFWKYHLSCWSGNGLYLWSLIVLPLLHMCYHLEGYLGPKHCYL